MNAQILNRYMVKNLLMNNLIVLFLLLSIFFVFGFLDRLGDIGKGDYRIVDALFDIALMMPRNVCDLMPTVAIAGAMATLGIMAHNGELVVLRSCGLTLGELSLSLLRGGIALALFHIAMDEWVAPAAERRGERLRMEKIHGSNPLLRQGALWTRDHSTFIKVGSMESPTLARHLLIHEFDEQDRLVRSLRAERAEYIDGRWHLRGVNHSRLAHQNLQQTPGQDAGLGIEASQIEQEIRDFSIDPQAIKHAAHAPGKLSAIELAQHIDYLRNSGQKDSAYRHALYAKLFDPLAILLMLPLGLAMISSALGRDASLAQRAFTGILIGLVWHVLCQLARNISVIYAFPPLLGVGGPVFLLAGLVYWRLRAVS